MASLRKQAPKYASGTSRIICLPSFTFAPTHQPQNHYSKCCELLLGLPAPGPWRLCSLHLPELHSVMVHLNLAPFCVGWHDFAGSPGNPSRMVRYPFWVSSPCGTRLFPCWICEAKPCLEGPWAHVVQLVTAFGEWTTWINSSLNPNLSWYPLVHTSLNPVW